ncbi:MAG TPA: hypothetical protein VLL27_13255 [Solirubrobacterales bacterium]|nr:hypothetical protein [Solirubrobacterales bacterium]
MDLGLIGWLDAHSGAITALATVVLVLITVAYVIVTYWLVREQRMQAHIPEIEYEWAERDKLCADLRLHNVGSGTATEVTIVRGPGQCLEVEMPNLGQRAALLSGQKTDWPIRPLPPSEDFDSGDLSLTISYFGNNCMRAYFHVLLLQFGVPEGRFGIRDRGSLSDVLTMQQLRRLTSRSLPLRERLGFRRRTRKMDLSLLLLDTQARDALRAKLGELFEELQALSKRAEKYRHNI